MLLRVRQKLLSPLHRAVVDGDVIVLKKMIQQGIDLHGRDPLGFTPQELAQLLGKKECQFLLQDVPTTSFSVQGKGEEQPKKLSIAAFEAFFGVVYRPYLYFPSYAALCQTIANCPYILRCKWLAQENYALTQQYKRSLMQGMLAPLYVKWMNDSLGYGILAEKEIVKGSFVGEYTGVVRQLLRLQQNQNAYCLHYPTRFWSRQYMVIDALQEGNLMRFMNHSDCPNVEPVCLVDRGLLHLAFIAKCDITQHTQLTFDYGNDFWQHRQKYLEA